MNSNIQVSKILYHWILLLHPFFFCETYNLHFTTCVFGQSAIFPFLGGKSLTNLCTAHLSCYFFSDRTIRPHLDHSHNLKPQNAQYHDSNLELSANVGSEKLGIFLAESVLTLKQKTPKRSEEKQPLKDLLGLQCLFFRAL